MSLFEVKVSGLKELNGAISMSMSRIVPIGKMTMQANADEIMTISKRDYCPVVTGELRNSGFVTHATSSLSGIGVTMGYRAPYALKVHENPRAGVTGGQSPRGKSYTKFSKTGEWKFLETPVRLHTPKVRKKLTDRFSQMFARLFK